MRLKETQCGVLCDEVMLCGAVRLMHLSETEVEQYRTNMAIGNIDKNIARMRIRIEHPINIDL